MVLQQLTCRYQDATTLLDRYATIAITDRELVLIFKLEIKAKLDVERRD